MHNHKAPPERISFLQSLVGEVGFHISEENLQIRADQIRARLRLYPVMIIIQVLLEPLFVWLFWKHSEQETLLLWLACIYTVHALDILTWWRYREYLHTLQECRQWSNRFKLFTILTATMWGLNAILFFPHDLAFQAALICLSLGLVAGAITLDSTFPPSMYIYVLGVSIPLFGCLVYYGEITQWILAGMLLLYLFGTLSAGRDLSKTYWKSLWQRYENDQLIEQLTIQKAIAEAASRDKSRFLASASHDLRQPLQALVLFSESLQETTKDNESRHLASQIGKSVGALVDMFDELLDMSKLDAGVVQAVKQNFKVQTIFDRLQTDFMPQTVAKDIEFVMQPTDLFAYSDPHLVERILRNLISNAIRYTDFGSVSVNCELENGKLNFDVMDTGIGIRAKSLPHIFEEYYQVDNQHRDRLKGLGLGLAIVRRMEVLLGCHVTVVSRPALGSVFSFSIPQGKEIIEAPPQPQQQAKHDLSGVRIALVDDNREIRVTVSSLLQQWGCHVHVGELPHDVLNAMAVADTRPDILICDYRLPNGLTAIDGINLLHALWDRTIPTLVLTGDTAPQTLQKIQSSGAVLLHKPITPARLRSIMYFALRSNNNIAEA